LDIHLIGRFVKLKAIESFPISNRSLDASDLTWARQAPKQIARRLLKNYPWANMQHAPGFLKIVEAVRPLIREVAPAQARERLRSNPRAVLIDVREDNEWTDGHAAEAIHLGKGILERDIEKMVPDPATEIILYCGGGYRSALAAEVAQRMGYNNVFSLAGGYKAMAAAGWPEDAAAKHC
jgi:rhodanese-related sulfurtransferase